MKDNPYSIVLVVSVMIGETQHSGEILPRCLNQEEMSVLGLSDTVAIVKNYTSYKEALLGLQETIQKVQNV